MLPGILGLLQQPHPTTRLSPGQRLLSGVLPRSRQACFLGTWLTHHVEGFPVHYGTSKLWATKPVTWASEI